MATSEEVLDVIEMLLDAYPHYKPRSVEGLVTLWTRKFEEWDATTLQKAADMHIDKAKFFPSIHEIKDLEYHAGEDYAIENMPFIEEEWNSQSQETKDFWIQMAKEDGREMLKPGLWGPMSEEAKRKMNRGIEGA